jgi:putative addiction module component (TIGR02574 family)
METACQTRLRKRVATTALGEFMTTQTTEIFDVVDHLPIDMKLELIDHLLESISPSKKEIDEAWMEEVERRIDEAENGEVELIPGEEVFARMRERYKE